MINKLWTGSILLFCPMGLQAQNWLPDTANAHQEIRLLDCRYHEEKLKSCEQLTDTSSCWRTSVEKTEVTDGTLFVFRFKALKNLTDAGVAVAFDRYHWTSDNYVMIPASVYNGNRQRIVNRNYATGLDPSDYDRPDLALTSNPIPQLSPDFGSPSRLEVSVCNAATPAIAFLDRQKKEGVLLLTDQGIVRDGQVLDHGLIVEETPDRNVASFVISAPGVREKKPEFIGFSKSPDPGNHGARRGRNRHPRHTPRLSLHGRTRPARAFHGRAQTPHPVRRTAQFSTDELGVGHYGQKHRPPLLPKRQRGILPPRNGGLDVVRVDWRPHQYLSDARARRRRAPAPRGAHLRLRPAPGERQKRILL